MTCATLMVHLEVGHSNLRLLQVAGDFAERFGAGVIGIAACQPMQMVYGNEFASRSVIEADLVEIDRQIKEAEAEFRSALRGRVETIAWRSTVIFGVLSEYLAREARSADLVITGAVSGTFLDTSRRVGSGELVMQVGRPVLIVPDAVDKLSLERMIVAWKDTREARRAAFDALPLLKKATHVAVVEIAAEEELAAARTRLDDVVGWLKQHGITAEPVAVPSMSEDAGRLAAIAENQGADVIVAGAYGHGRMREWVFGGVTRDLLLGGNHCSFVSH